MTDAISSSLPHPPPPAKADVADTEIASNLAGLQRSYQAAIKDGDSPGTLSALAKQISDAAQTLGLAVDLPRASPVAAANGVGVKMDVHA